MRSVMTLVLTLLAMALGTSTSSAADQAVTPATFQRAFAAAQPGDRLLLASGDYGDFSGGAKSGLVTITAAVRRDASMSIVFNGAAISASRPDDHLMDIDGVSHDLTFSNSTFTGQRARPGLSLDNANIVFDHNTHAGINVVRHVLRGPPGHHRTTAASLGRGHQELDLRPRR